jgi:hypothetical protein
MDYQSKNISLLANSRFRRIARDLEKLPCELHDGVLADLEFEQLIRLTSCAGPRLTWSLANSLAPWGHLFRGENVEDWQKLLSASDRLRLLCFKLPTKKGERPYLFDHSHGPLAFLAYRGAEWKTKDFGELDRGALVGHWRSTLNNLIVGTTYAAFHHKYDRMIEPWMNQLQGAAEVFSKKSNLSVDELVKFINLYQQLRLIQAKALAGELLHLADLYEAHPTRLIEVYAPQPRSNKRPFNPKHVPHKLRHEARNMVRRAQTTRWNDKEEHGYRFMATTPALVPYDWATQLFNKVLQEPIYMESAAKTSQPAFLTNCKVFLERDSVASLTHTFAQQQLDTGVQKPIYVKPWLGYRRSYCPLADAELEWLQTCVEVTTWMEEEFPDVVREVRVKDEERGPRAFEMP